MNTSKLLGIQHNPTLPPQFSDQGLAVVDHRDLKQIASTLCAIAVRTLHPYLAVRTKHDIAPELTK